MAGKKKPSSSSRASCPTGNAHARAFDARLNVEDRPMTQPELVAAVRS